MALGGLVGLIAHVSKAAVCPLISPAFAPSILMAAAL